MEVSRSRKVGVGRGLVWRVFVLGLLVGLRYVFLSVFGGSSGFEFCVEVLFCRFFFGLFLALFVVFVIGVFFLSFCFELGVWRAFERWT